MSVSEPTETHEFDVRPLAQADRVGEFFDGAHEAKDGDCTHEAWEATSQWRDDVTNEWHTSRRCADCNQAMEPIKSIRYEGGKTYDAPPEAQKLPPQPLRRPASIVTYSVEGGHLYEVLVPGDATVVAIDGRLSLVHRDHAVLGIAQVKPFEPLGEERHDAEHEGGEGSAG